MTESERPAGPEIIRDIVARLPGKPGVYRMYDAKGDVLYVGKARNLRNRVSNYARLGGHTNRIAAMIALTAAMEFVTTTTEAEALLLEANLIKKLKPRYNVILRDDKSFPYILIAKDHPFAQLTKHRGARNRKGSYYGPFASANSLRSAIRTLNRIFRLRDCTDNEFANRSRPCINHQIGICSAPCTNLISVEDYQRDMENALQVLSGHPQEAVSRLRGEMESFSEKMEYEQAARVRDQIAALEDTIKRRREGSSVERQAIEGADRDVVGWYRKPDAAAIALLFVRGGNF